MKREELLRLGAALLLPGIAVAAVASAFGVAPSWSVLAGLVVTNLVTLVVLHRRAMRLVAATTGAARRQHRSLARSLDRTQRLLARLDEKAGAPAGGAAADTGPVLERLEAIQGSNISFRRGLMKELATSLDEHLVRLDRLEQKVDQLGTAHGALESRALEIETTTRSQQQTLQRALRDINGLPRSVELLHQIEATVELRTRFTGAALLPLTGGWRATPTTLLRLLEEIERQRSTLVVECGSGVSTLWIAYMLRELGEGHCVALEHEEAFAEQTRQLIGRHGLADWATVRHAPLVDQAEGTWYAREAWADLESIDLLFVDGPPAATGPLARRPALEVFRGALRQGSVILLDDSAREEERQIVADWLATGSVRLEDSSTDQKGWACLEFVG